MELSLQFYCPRCDFRESWDNEWTCPLCHMSDIVLNGYDTTGNRRLLCRNDACPQLSFTLLRHVTKLPSKYLYELCRDGIKKLLDAQSNDLPQALIKVIRIYEECLSMEKKCNDFKKSA